MTCFAAAVASAQPLEAKHVPLLEKLLEHQDLAGDLPGSARTAELMAAFGATAADRASRHLRAAHDYFAAGDKLRARAAAERAVENDPYDVEAVDLASQLAIDQERCRGGVVDVDAPVDGERRPLRRRARATSRVAVVPARSRARRPRRHAASAPCVRARDRDHSGFRGRDRSLGEHSSSSRKQGTGDDPSRAMPIAAHLGAITASTGAFTGSRRVADELRRPEQADGARATPGARVVRPRARCPPERISPRPPAVRDARRRAVPRRGRRPLADDRPRSLGARADRATLAEAAALHVARISKRGWRAWVVPARSRVPGVVPRCLGLDVPAADHRARHRRGHALSKRRRARRHGRRGGTPVVVLAPRTAPKKSPLPSTSRALLARAVELTRPEHLAFAGLPVGDSTRLPPRSCGSSARPRCATRSPRRIADEDVQRAHDEMVKAALPVKLRTRLDSVARRRPGGRAR